MGPHASTPTWPPGGDEMARRIRDHDWAATPLGPIEGWPERLRGAVEGMLATPLVGSLACGPGRVLLYNDVASALFGGFHPAALGRPLPETWPEGYATVAHFYERAFAGEAVRVPRQPLDVSGEGGQVFDAVLTPVRDAAGAVMAVQMLGFEVSGQLRAEVALRDSEARQAFLLGLSDALRPLADPVEITGTATRLLGEGLGASRAYYVEWPPGAEYGEVARDHAAPGLPSLAGRYPIEAFRATYDRISEGRTWIVEDNATAPGIAAAEREYYRNAGVIAWVDVPLAKRGRIQAALCVVQGEPRRWTGTEVGLIEETAERCWAAIERARAEAALRQSEEKYRTIVEAVRDYAIFTTDAAGRIETWPAGAELVFGWMAGEAVGRPMDITFTPEDRLAGEPLKERQGAREKGQAPDVRWHQRKDGARVFIEGMVRPLVGPDGTVAGFLKVGQDVTARRATEAALHESEARFRQFGDASADVLWIRDCESLAFEYVSPAFEEIYGHKIEAMLGSNDIRRWAELIVPEDREEALDAIRRVREGEHVLHSFRVLRSDGEVRWIRDTSFPLLDEKGRVQRIAGIGHDATEEVELQDRLRVLVAELQHRSRNLVGVVKGVVERSMATSETLEDFRARFRPRLDALARVNSLLSRLDEGDRITFDQLLQAELMAHGVMGFDGQGGQIRLSGPKGVRLRSATVQTFALALHELATNALKHGALSWPEGRLEVTWSLTFGKGGERRLRVDWLESGVPPLRDVDADEVAAASPRHQGFGRELIERALPYQLKARTSYELTPEGVRCTIVVPVSSSLDVAFSSQ